MKKLLFTFVLAVSMVLTSCDCGCDVEPVDLKNPEIKVYRLYNENNDFNKLYIYKYETPDAYIYRYVISGETRNINIIPKAQENAAKENHESVLQQGTYFDY